MQSQTDRSTRHELKRHVTQTLSHGRAHGDDTRTHTRGGEEEGVMVGAARRGRTGRLAASGAHAASLGSSTMQLPSSPPHPRFHPLTRIRMLTPMLSDPHPALPNTPVEARSAKHESCPAVPSSTRQRLVVLPISRALGSTTYESAPLLPPPSAARRRSHWRVRVGITFFGERDELGRMLR